MAQSSTIFITASDARQNPIRETVVHDEAREIENAVLAAVKLGLFDCTVDNGTPMTMSNIEPTEVWTVDPSTGILYVPNHGLITGDAVNVSSTGNLPSPLISTKFYYVIYIDEDHIKLATSFANAVNGKPTSIEITSAVNSITLANSGSGYLQAPAVSFSGGNPIIPATATAYLADWGSVVAINNTTSGAGYTDLPSVQIVAQGSGAVADIISYTCVSAGVAALGSNYRVGDLISVTGGTGTATTLRVTDINTNGGVLAISVANGGDYSLLPSVIGATTTVSPGGGTGCTVNLSFGIKSISLSSVGTGYIAAPRVIINSTTGSGAEAVANLFGGSLNEIIIVNPGYGYLDVSSVDFDTGSSASATVMLKPTSVSTVTVTYNGGNTYTSTPSVSIDTQGIGATAGTVTMKVISVQLVSGGSNYQVGDTLLVAGGVTTENAWIKVQTVTPYGGIMTYTLESGGLYTGLPGLTSNPVTGGSGNLASFNLSMGIESIAVQTAGNGYIVPPVVSISPPGNFGSMAIARAEISSGGVVSFIVEKSGYGYDSIPSVTLANGSGASAEVYLAATTVDSISMLNVGSGYTYANVIISGGDASVDATAIANISAGQIYSIDIINPGSGYTSTPTITITGDGLNAAAEVVLVATSISYINVTNNGSGYNVRPTVTVDGLATAESILVGTGVQNIVIDSIGDNYVADPIVYLIPGIYQQSIPVPPVMESTRAFSIANIVLTNTGEGYTSTPDVTLSAPFFSIGTTATASATIGTGAGTFVLTPYPSSRDYFAAWKGLALSNSQLSRPYIERMETVIAYFTNLGYSINRLTNPVTNNTLMWAIQW